MDVSLHGYPGSSNLLALSIRIPSALLSAIDTGARLHYSSPEHVLELADHQQHAVSRHAEDPDKNQVLQLRGSRLVQTASIHEKLNVLPKAFKGDRAAKKVTPTTSTSTLVEVEVEEALEHRIKYTLATGDYTYTQLMSKIGKACQRDEVERALNKVASKGKDDAYRINEDILLGLKLEEWPLYT
jgi:hypothetical protein